MSIIRVMDFETTGEAPPAEVCEVGWSDLDTEAKTISPPLSRLCRVKEMPPEVRAVHHITLAETQMFPVFDIAVFLQEAKDDGVVGIAAHNLKFEAQWIGETDLYQICTYKCALRAWPDAPAHNNGALRYWLEDQGKIATLPHLAQPSHRAGPDAYVTAHLLLALFEHGVEGRRMTAWTRDPACYPTCPLGKFRGKPWTEVEGGFLGWMLRQPDMEPDLKWNAQREWDRRHA